MVICLILMIMGITAAENGSPPSAASHRWGTAGKTGSQAVTSPPSGLLKTYYVRSGGGNATQCDGLTDSDFSEGASGHCAFNHPFWALPPGSTPLLAGGDTLLIHQGTYRMGYGAPNTENCDSLWPWECRMPPVPSGTPEQPTRILGDGWDAGCTNPPVLSGVERASSVLDLTGSNFTEVSCLEITDDDACVEDNPQIPCKRDAYPYGNWSATGVTAADSRNVTLRDLNVHGLANRGISAGRLSNWSLLNTSISFNGWSGFNGDIDGTDRDSGLIYFSRVNISWNGCGEDKYHQPVGCNGQTGGGYGDGLGTGFTGGDWVFEDCVFSHSTSDGMDLLYHTLGGTITLRRVWSEGNAGNQIKTQGDTAIENTVMIGNCAFFENKSFTYYVDPKTPGVDPCRAGGDALMIAVGNGTRISLVNSEIYSEGVTLIDVDQETKPCNGKERFVSRNNIFVGGPCFYKGGEQSALFYNGDPACPGLKFDNNYSVIDSVQEGTFTLMDHDILAASGLGRIGPDLFSMQPPEDSVAIDNGLPVGSPAGIGKVPGQDISMVARPIGEGVDIGAYEFNSTGLNKTPRATFVANVTEGIVPLNVGFTDTSRGPPEAWDWDFGDGNRSTLADPVHTYEIPGIYTVSLNVTNDRGFNRSVRPRLVRAIPPGDFGIRLQPGWNFIATPRQLSAGNDSALIFSGVDTTGHSIWQYNTRTRQWTAMGPATTVSVLDGIWIYSHNSTGVPLYFETDPLRVPATKICPEGWNAIGFSDLVNSTARDTLLAVSPNWTTLIGFDATGQEYEDAMINGGSGIYSDQREMVPGHGYWLYMKGPGELVAISV